MPKISAIVPVYKSEKYLEKCLDSILKQTLDDVEIIIVNDGSPDNSQAIIDSYVEKYPEKIKAFIQENKGQAAARNFALEYAKGDFISFVDSDDYLEVNAYKSAYKYASENNLDIVCFGMYEVRFGEKEAIDYKYATSDDVRKQYILNESSPCNKIVRRSLVEENNLRFTESRIYEDFELIPQFALYTDKIGYIDECLYNYVIHHGSTMRQKEYNKKLTCIFDVAETLKEKFYDTEYRTELEFLYIEHLLHGAVLRFLAYPEGDADIIRIADVVKKTFPKWRRNKYFKMQNWKYKLMCNLSYMKAIFVLRKIFGEK